jgi:hypothetical protein
MLDHRTHLGNPPKEGVHSPRRAVTGMGPSSGVGATHLARAQMMSKFPAKALDTAGRSNLHRKKPCALDASAVHSRVQAILLGSGRVFVSWLAHG